AKQQTSFVLFNVPQRLTAMGLFCLPEKPGFCRVFPPDTMGICALLCFSDDDCAGAEKCCSNGCGRTCQTPHVVVFIA
uniref:WAP domain-containing protein n=1 Tax=Chrysemys picta bellii TaxID=8478 RepID=A0A8C3IY05_CHRPI